MKRKIGFALVLALLLGCLAGCNFTTNLSGAMAGESETEPKVTEMMTALSHGDTADALALLHPQVAETAERAVGQMGGYLAGRTVSAMEQISININTSVGTGGTTRQERAGYRVTLSDGDVIFINAVYLSNTAGSGFASFQLVLGVV